MNQCLRAAMLIAGVILLVAVLSDIGVVRAQEMRTFSWDPPTQRTDGKPLAPSEIASYKFGCSLVSGRYDGMTFTAPGGTTRSHQIPATAMLDGVNYCAAKAVDTGGRESAWSAETTWTPPPKQPAPPTNFRFGP